jgi:Domain of unknown function (DUF4252)
MIRRFARPLFVAGTGLALVACGFTGNLRTNPGFAPLRTPRTMYETNRELALSLGPIPLRLAKMASHVAFRDEPWIQTALKDVRAVRVYAYDVDGDVVALSGEMERQKQALMAEGWQAVLVVREDGGLVQALVMPNETANVVEGLVVLYQDEEDLVLVNVIGRLRPETFGTLMDELDIEVPLMAWN